MGKTFTLRTSQRAGRAAGLALAILGTAACGDDTGDENGASDPNDLGLLRQVLVTNANIAVASYSDSLTTARELETAIDALIDAPSAASLQAAREAWLVAQEPYGQTEVYRFRASPIDDTNYDPTDGEDGPEGDINAWPLGEGLIDYVVRGNDFGDDQINVTDHETGVSGPIPENNIINSTDIPIDASLLQNSATAKDERDVIAGYHAIEFLLWGQDLNEDGSADTENSRDATPGQRPFTDFLQTDDCTSGDAVNGEPTLCERRGQYLRVAAQKLIADLESVRDAWTEGASYRTAFTEVDNLEQGKRRLLEILTGMGTLSEGELAGERMQIALSADSQEDEHSCFSDNTHRDIWTNAEGIENAFYGDYGGYDADLDGTDEVTTNAVQGYGIDDYLNDIGRSDLASEVAAALTTTQQHYRAIDEAARNGMPVDMVIIDPTSVEAQPMRNAIVSLNAQSGRIAQIALDLGLGDVNDVIDPDASECDTTDPTTEC